ncbi:GntR family transcriptional regulator [Microbispora bryophytorum]|uniref:GntR family transcriptional regulator n=1 Tax=Microbispora bryophytorum subsp. camponoti TaxID=1677852 RepID=A0ABR8LIJ7_9ACTN|nr:GntR family transcriptional regulator [Microbispora camponoti]MBD3148434.1 GntR family transcriptional regulator [Microbispora camponoti]
MAEEKEAARWRIIADLLRNDVLEDHYQPGQALPGEAFLASEYATSRPTIRKAIAQLAGEGLLTVAHGRGTFVRPTPDRRLILTGWPDHEDLLSPAYNPAKQGWEYVTVPSEAERAQSKVTPNSALFMTAEGNRADILAVRRGTMVVYRYAYWQHTKTRARIHLSSYVLADQVATIRGEGSGREIESHVEPEDYYAHLERQHGPLRWTASVHARMPYGETYEDLGMEPIGTPLLVVRRVMLSQHGRPLEFTEIEAPGDRFEAASVSDHETFEPGGLAALRV